tara:strand:- start:1377 stop:1958 length:582 start_codon:yes stop_codon:yes gene_type:complete
MQKKIFIQILLSVLILIIFLVVYEKYFKKTSISDTSLIKEEEKNQPNSLENITYDSVDREGRKYIITAESGLFNEKEPDIIFMTNVNAKIILIDGSIIYIKSSNAEYNSLNYNTEFQKEVELKFLEHNVFCNNLNIFFQDNLLEAYNDLTYKNLDIIMLADKIEIDLLTKNSKIFNFNERKVKIKKRNINGNN